MAITTALETAFCTILDADTTLGALVSTLEPFPASANAARPFLTYRLMGEPITQEMLGNSAWQRLTYRFTCYDAQPAEGAPDNSAAMTAIARVIALLHRVNLTVTGYTCMAVLAKSRYATTVEDIGGTYYMGVSVDMEYWIA